MAGLRLTLRGEPGQRLDLSALTPDRLAGLAEAEILRLPLATTREFAVVGDVFVLAMGDSSDIVIEGGSGRLDYIGAEMTRGAMRVEGDAGFCAGRGMRGGRLVIAGNAGAAAASGIRGGEILIEGYAGPSLAGPAPGEQAGMTGGIVVVRGGAGRGAAVRMRRGTIVIEGDADADAAVSMIAGTLVICGRSAGMPGQLMRRGSILLGHPVSPGANFVRSDGLAEAFLRLLANFLQPLSPRAASLASENLQRVTGDLATDGRGELLFPQTYTDGRKP